ncbi:MAG: HEPN domain-containing protein [Magnetococcales bacterium]|nr:HEPN domain-containing protein [Magnetococcales bacterium]MBF0116834.1 HEPN domain-containing protein [Magnetococcales bacterium]
MAIEQQVAHWRQGSDEDLEAAELMIQAGKLRHGLFFLHLSVEKIIKAHLWRVTGDYPPKIHNLIRLLQLAQLSLERSQSELLTRLNRYCLEGRYAEEVATPPEPELAREILQQTREVQEWLRNRL